MVHGNDGCADKIFRSYVLHSCTKPDPLTTYEGSYCNEEVDYFNAINWDTATYHELVEGMEGWIIHHPKTTIYLISHLFRMLILDRELPANIAADNHVEHLKGRLLDKKVSTLLSKGQNKRSSRLGVSSKRPKIPRKVYSKVRNRAETKKERH